MACSKIGFDLFLVGDEAIRRYIDSIEKDLPCQSKYYSSELTLLFLSILSLLSKQQQLLNFTIF